MDMFEKIKEKHKGQSTAYLIKNYHGYNSEYRKITRDELKRRHVPVSQLRKARIIRVTKKRPQQRIGFMGMPKVRW